MITRYIFTKGCHHTQDNANIITQKLPGPGSEVKSGIIYYESYNNFDVKCGNMSFVKESLASDENNSMAMCNRIIQDYRYVSIVCSCPVRTRITNDSLNRIKYTTSWNSKELRAHLEILCVNVEVFKACQSINRYLIE